MVERDEGDTIKRLRVTRVVSLRASRETERLSATVTGKTNPK
jgi:hypothetical protein